MLVVTIRQFPRSVEQKREIAEGVTRALVEA
ncbi:tautomerase family protein [Salinicola halimionae]|nr:tautomerase family protein [Salinicola halimionae]